MILTTDIQPPVVSCVSVSFAQGIGPEAETLRKQIQGIYDNWDKTLTMGDAKRELKVELIELFKECSQPNWDGYEAEPVTFFAYCQAEQALFSLPFTTPPPMMSAGSDGKIAFEWRSGKDRGLVMSIGSDGDLTYAGIFGSCSRVRGTEVFDGNIPQTILENIQRVFERR